MLAVSEATAKALHKGKVWWVAPTYPMALIGWKELRALARQIPFTIVREGEHSIAYPGGGFVQVKSADNPDSLRGEGLDLIVNDECGFMQKKAWEEAERPALSDRKGHAIFISTPKGKNWFWRLWTNAADGRNPEWRAWQYPTAANPFIDPEEIENARKGLPERVFLQEYMAQFIDDAGGVFRHIRDCANAEERPYIDGHQYVVGVDWGKYEDFTCFVVMDATTKSVVFLDHFSRIDYVVQRQRLKVVADRYKPAKIVVERTGIGDVNAEELVRDGLPVFPYDMQQRQKQVAIDALCLAFEQGDIHILNEDDLITELEAYEAERLPSGMLRYGAPQGMHDDRVMALAMAWQAVAFAPPVLVASEYDPEAEWRRMQWEE